MTPINRQMSISCFWGKKKKKSCEKKQTAHCVGTQCKVLFLMPPLPNLLLSPASCDSRHSCCCATPVIGEAAGGWPALSHQTAAGCRIFPRRRRLQNNLLTSDKLFKAKRSRCDPRRCRGPWRAHASPHSTKATALIVNRAIDTVQLNIASSARNAGRYWM